MCGVESTGSVQRNKEEKKPTGQCVWTKCMGQYKVCGTRLVPTGTGTRLLPHGVECYASTRWTLEGAHSTRRTKTVRIGRIETASQKTMFPPREKKDTRPSHGQPSVLLRIAGAPGSPDTGVPPLRSARLPAGELGTRRGAARAAAGGARTAAARARTGGPPPRALLILQGIVLSFLVILQGIVLFFPSNNITRDCSPSLLISQGIALLPL